MTRVSQGVSGRGEGNVNLVSPAVQCTLPFILLESSLIHIYSTKKPPGKIFPLIILVWRVKIREEVGFFNYYFYLCNMPGSYNGNKVVAKHWWRAEFNSGNGIWFCIIPTSGEKIAYQIQGNFNSLKMYAHTPKHTVMGKLTNMKTNSSGLLL